MEIDDKVMDEFVDMLFKVNKKNTMDQLNKTNIEFCQEGYVTGVDNTLKVADVQLLNTLLEDVPNLTGTSLTVNQKVKIFYNNRNMSGCYIGTAF